MAYEYLKKLFKTTKDGEPQAMTYDELEKAIDSAKDIKLVNLSEGQYVAKSKFDAKETELNGVKDQLKDANEQIESYKDQDIDSIKQNAADWQKKYEDSKKELEQKLADQERSHQTDMFMANYNFTSKAAKNGILDEFKKKDFKLEDGKFLGAEDFMNELMESDDYKGAFVTEEEGEEVEEGSGGDNSQPHFSQSTNTPGSQKATGQTFNFGFQGVRKHEE